MIRVEGLTKDYGARRAVENLTFNAEKGEILGFLGPNGAGKTTTMRILSGYMPPTSGKVEIAGFDVVEQSLEVRRRVGYMPETVPLYPDMTVFDYLKFMADLRHLSDAEDRVDDVLEKVHMEDRADGYIGKLSKGMRQRVGLAQALLHEPEVLILDEPTIGLDPAQITDVRKLIQDIGRERTILLSTHILSEAQQVCNRVLIINKGKIVVEDTPEKLQARLSGAQRIVLKVGGDSDGLLNILKHVEGVNRVVPNVNGAVEFENIPGQDPRPAVARAVVEAGYDLLEIRPIGLSLEEIFLQLTRDEPEPPTTADYERLDDPIDSDGSYADETNDDQAIDSEDQ
jgi:ABC-2 type transport system ATP-binding protein